ncbi:allograft inflammatory factor 1-like [Mytilus trossulus]|uniref:allograft inflammatory factor 1-like n=1 Tax=Mytilus trossulus TaxID=6551 RepID=UPI003005F167
MAEKPKLDPKDYQGGRAFGQLMEDREAALEAINKDFLEDDKYKEVEDIEEKLQTYKNKFLEFDLDTSGDIDKMGLKQMLEKLGQPKTHLELMKIIKEVDTTGSGTISYQEFLWMMLGGKSSILRLILFFENAAKDADKPHGIAPKRTLSSLP